MAAAARISGQASLGGALLGDGLEPDPDLLDVAAEVVEAWQLGEALQPEDALEERCRAVANGAAGAGLAPGLRDQPPLDQPRDRGVDRHPADARDLRPRARPEVRDDRQRL